MLSEKVVLIGKGMYQTIPDEITISAVPTASELEYVGAEDFDRCMITKILPKVVDNSEGMNFTELFDFDYDWICRCLRMKSYGPFFTTNRVYCPDCNDVHKGEYHADLRNVPITPLPEGFINQLVIPSDEFIDNEEEVTFKLITVQDNLLIEGDKLFDRPDGTKNNVLARICYSIKQIGNRKNLTPVDVRSWINNKLSAADYEILKNEISERTNFGIHIMGSIPCPVCGSKDAYFIALQKDKFFRPTLGDIKQYKSAVRSGDWKKLPGNPRDYVRSDS